MGIHRGRYTSLLQAKELMMGILYEQLERWVGGFRGGSV